MINILFGIELLTTRVVPIYTNAIICPCCHLLLLDILSKQRLK